MRFLKEKKGIIISFIIGVILASSITVYAYSYFASDIKYKDGKNVAEALDDLYQKFNTPVTINSDLRKGNYSGENEESVTINNLEADSYYICFAQYRKDISQISVSNAEIIYDSGYNSWYMNGLFATHTVYIHTLSTSVTFTVPGTDGMYVTIYKISKD